MEKAEEKKYPAKHPLEIWKSREVTDLLIEFFGVNFKKAGLPEKMARDLILTAFKNRKTADREGLRRVCEKIMLEAKDRAKNPPDEIDPIELFDLNETEMFLDIGANKLATINYLAKKHKNIKKLIGIDTIPQRSNFHEPQKSSYFQVSPKAKSFPIKKESVDFINLQFVFHHFPDAGSIKRMLSICRKILKPGGMILLWEESFTKKFDPEMIKINRRLGIKTDKIITEKFYSLNEKKRWEFIIANDWLINVSSSHMPWTGQYRTWPEWEKLMYDAGFYFKKSYNFGLRASGRLKQGAHMIGMFKKLKILNGSNVFVKNRKLKKILFVLRDNKPNILYPGKWGNFGGGVEEGESPLEAIKREIKEESNIKISNFKLLGKEKVTHILCGEKFPRTSHYYIAETDAKLGETKIFEGQRARYFTLKEILANKNLGPVARKMIKKYYKEISSF
ncbi:MAG: NUDIX domain-containing protein [Parcubacteria group bacterium]|jgi:8-oxo-dGTP pyrophosphatase MutT (NUDIX family)/ubiquinone/menaquinone biosynthesis C-methylase UbiE